MKGEDQGRKQDEEGPVRLHGDESVDPNTEASLSLSLSLSPFLPALRLPSKGSAHVSPGRESVSAACACAHNAKGSGRNGRRGCLQCPFRGLPSNFEAAKGGEAR